MSQIVSTPETSKGTSEQLAAQNQTNTRTQVVLLPDDGSRVDELGKILEAKHKGEFKRPHTISRALDALARELNASSPAVLAQV